MSGAPSAIGIFGGSFDPVHDAHLALASVFAERFGLNEVRFLPAGDPWQKQLSATGEQRLAMLQEALAETAKTGVGTRATMGALWQSRIDTRELQRHGATYTIDTLIDIRAEVGPQVPLVLLIGADQLLRLHTWHRWGELFEWAHLGVAARPGFVLSELPETVERERQKRRVDPSHLCRKPAGGISIIDDVAYDISATAIRAALRDPLQRAPSPTGMLAGLLPAAVLDYIRTHNLYRN